MSAHRQAQHIAIIGISHWVWAKYGCDYDSLMVRAIRASAHIDAPFGGFQSDSLNHAERIEPLLHIMLLRAKPRKDVTEALVEVLPKLTPKQRGVLMMHMAGYRHHQISGVLGITVNASKKILGRVRVKAVGVMN